jgi:tetratricopeptide (TPR) repeat protein
LQAKKFLERGDIDQAIMAYRRVRPVSVRILKIIGQLSADEKQDYDTAIECYRQALKMQEQVKSLTIVIFKKRTRNRFKYFILGRGEYCRYSFTTRYMLS